MLSISRPLPCVAPTIGFKLLLSAILCTLMFIPLTHAQDAASLKARHTALREQLADNPFKRPLHLESTEDKRELNGDIYAQIDKPFAVIVPALKGENHWCDILILHLNVKSCRATTTNAGSALRMHIGRKFDRPLDGTYSFDFLYKVAAARRDYLQVVLSAAEGPMGTSDYRVVLEVIPLDAKRSFLHLSYAYSYGIVASVAMKSYLATTGRDKAGFSIVDHNAAGQPIYVGSVRGVVERNTMRYYLAIEAYLSAPAPKQLEQRLNNWHTAVERYPIQLHEMERAEYLAMKRKEVKRQQAPAAVVASTP